MLTLEGWGCRVNGLRAVYALYALAQADYLERARRSSFLIILGLTVIAGYVYLPANSSTTRTLAFTLDFGGYRGVYNSAWVGVQVALFATLWLSLIGFYLVKNTVERDVRTGVGQIIAATSLRKVEYTLGKALSNFAVLATMVVILVIEAGAMQLLRGEDTHIDLWALLSPFVFIMLPTMAVVAAMAILFETIGWLRGTLGNVVYFLLISTVLTLTFAVNPGTISDLLGLNFPLAQMQQGIMTAVPGFHGSLNIGTRFSTLSYSTFHWGGIQWTAEVLLSRLFWLGIAFAIAVFAALFFTRFDTTYEKQRGTVESVEDSVDSTGLSGSPELMGSPGRPRGAALHLPVQVHLTPLAGQKWAWRWMGIFVGEMRLLLKGVVWWWFIGAAALIVLCLVLPFDIALSYLFPVAWLWTLPLWSGLGSREARHHTTQLVFSTAHPLTRQLPVQWLAGVAIALLTASGMIAHFVLMSDWAGLLALGVGAIFVSALALAGGVWTGSSRLFEVVFVTLWYVGVINHLPVLDFMGVNGAALSMHVPLVYGIAAITLLFLALLGRWRYMHH